MSAPRYCSDLRPHDGHEWSDGDEVHTMSGEHVWSSLFYCWGVKDGHAAARAELIAARERHQVEVMRIDGMLDAIGIQDRRSESEFYEGDRL